eukprot:205209_1
MYKIITGYTHCSVNVNRLLLHKEINNEMPMLCFMGIFFKELESTNIKATDMQDFAEYIAENEYDTDSIIDDVYEEMNRISNIRKYFESKNKHELFISVKNIIHKFNQPAQIKLHAKICGGGLKLKVFDFPDCSYISTIIKALKQYSDCIQIQITLSELLGAYDHIVSIHNLHASVKNIEDNEQTVKQYIIQQIGMCELKDCAAVACHISRQREVSDVINAEKYEDKNDDHDLTEIMTATITALHTYLMHNSNEPYRLRRIKTNSHFLSSINDNFQDDQSNDHEESKNDSFSAVKFGESVIKWFKYDDEPKQQTFRDAIISNPESTISEKLFLNFARECYFKLINNKMEQYTMNELLCIKIYTDTNDY